MTLDTLGCRPYPTLPRRATVNGALALGVAMPMGKVKVKVNLKVKGGEKGIRAELLGICRSIVMLGLLLGSLIPDGAFAWVYPEHREIALRAVDDLGDADLRRLQAMWLEARTDHEDRLCESVAVDDQGPAPTCLDWPALSAIGGDHSCSAMQLMNTAVDSEWILAVADVGAQLKADLNAIQATEPARQLRRTSNVFSDAQALLEQEAGHARRSNALRTADTRMQREDTGYATRANANNAHFLLPRTGPDMTAREYAIAALSEGSDLNAIGVYTWYHLSALQKASRLAEEKLTERQRRRLIRAVLFDEGFALHFLEDAFASGHAAGTWGDASQRKGTNDFYNQNGLETFTWQGGSRSLILMGDAYMRDEDAQVAASAVTRSLRQILAAAYGDTSPSLPHRPQAPEDPDEFDVCVNLVFPPRPSELAADARYQTAFEETLGLTPVPGMGQGPGALPRFRSELGPFLGLSGLLDGKWVDGSFAAGQSDESGYVTGVELAVRAGIGLEGALGEHSDGLVSVSAGLRRDGASSHEFASRQTGTSAGNLSAAIPARSGLTLHMRLPFSLVPADLLLLSPLYLFNPEAYSRVAIAAVNGGLIPWQQGIATRIGRFQFVLGRELGVTWYGLDEQDQLLSPGSDPAEPPMVIDFKSTAYELPILEYRPYRAFSSNQSSSITFQLYAGVDVPRGGRVVRPEGQPPMDLDRVWYLGIRMGYGWRYYF